MDKNTEILLIISGPVGVGKTSVANELSTLLEHNFVSHTFIDLDSLTYTFPRTSKDPHGNELALENLKEVWKNSRKRSVRNLIIPRVVEAPSHVTDISLAVGITKPILCRLSASDETLIERVRSREIGSGLEWHEKRSLELSKKLEHVSLEDFCLTTDNCSINEIAKDLMLRIDWCR